MNKIALWISNRGNDWKAESAMIASNANMLQNSSTVMFKDKSNKITADHWTIKWNNAFCVYFCDNQIIIVQFPETHFYQ